MCPAADDDFVICRNAPYDQVLMLHVAKQTSNGLEADDDFVICWNAPYGQMLVLPS